MNKTSASSTYHSNQEKSPRCVVANMLACGIIVSEFELHSCYYVQFMTINLASIHLKEQTKYMQNQIDKIRDSVEDIQSRIAWQTINEVSRRNSTAKAKLKATNQ